MVEEGNSLPNLHVFRQWCQCHLCPSTELSDWSASPRIDTQRADELTEHHDLLNTITLFWEMYSSTSFLTAALISGVTDDESAEPSLTEFGRGRENASDGVVLTTLTWAE